VEDICLKCLEKPPTNRYATAAARTGGRDWFLAGQPTQTRPTGTIRRTLKPGEIKYGEIKYGEIKHPEISYE
jgi:hypothetical protein